MKSGYMDRGRDLEQAVTWRFTTVTLLLLW